MSGFGSNARMPAISGKRHASHKKLLAGELTREARYGWLIPLTILFYAILSDTPYQSVAWTATLAAAIAMFGFRVINYNMFSFISVYIAISFIFYPIAAFLNLLLDYPAVEQSLWNETTTAMWGYAVGMGSFISGVIIINETQVSRLAISKCLLTTNAKFNIVLAFLIVPVMLAKFSLGLYYHSSITEYAFSKNKYLNILSLVTWVSYCGIFLQVYRFTITKEKKDAVIALFLTSLPIVIFLPSGSREQALAHIPLLLMFFCFWEKRKHIKVLTLIAGIAIVFSLIVTVGIYRNLKGLENVDINTKYELLLTAYERSGNNIEDFLPVFISRISDFVATGRIIATTPERHPYRFTEGMETWWQIAIPGFIRPEKNQINFNDGADVTQKYGVSPGWWTSTPVMTIGDLFSRFGWAGVVIGMFGTGFLLRKLDFSFQNKSIIFRIVFFVMFSKIVWSLYTMSLLLNVVAFTRDLILTFVITIMITKLALRYR